MDIKQNKPIHLICPKCGFDYAINGSRLKEQKMDMNRKVQILRSKMATEKAAHGTKTQYYKELSKRYMDAVTQVQAIKQRISYASDESERQLFQIFKKELYQRYGQDEIVKILRECEDDLVYYGYDLARQKHGTIVRE